jgi:hypothetical protein
MKTIHVPDGIMHVSESKALCPVCHAPQPIEILEPKWIKAKGISMRHKCKCGTWMHITSNYLGDFVAYKTGKT